MKISIFISLITCVTFFHSKCVDGSGESSSRKKEVQPPPAKKSRKISDFEDDEEGPTPRRSDAPEIHIPHLSRVTVKVSDGSVLAGNLYSFGYDPAPLWIEYPEFGHHRISIRMPDKIIVAAQLREKKLPTQHGLAAPTSVTVEMPDGTSKNAFLEFLDKRKRSKLIVAADGETRAFVLMPDGLLFTGFFR